MCDTNCDRTFDSSSNIWRVTPLVEELSTTSISSLCFNNNKPEIEIKNLGIVKVDPEAYSKEYGSTMKPTLQMLNLTKNIKQVDRVKLASDQDAKYFMGLVGDVHALCMIDLEKEGLGAYKKFLEENSITCPVDSRNLNNFKNKTEIIKLELAGQELQTLDIYKERLNEYKQAIKPNEQKNDTEIIEKKDENKMLPIVSVQKVVNAANTELTAATPAQTVTPKLFNTTIQQQQQQLMNTTLTPIIPSITPVAPITPKMQTTITPLVPIQTPRPLTNMNTFIQTNANNNVTNPSNTTTNNNNNNTNAFKLNNQYNQIQINNLVNLLQFNYLKNSIAKNFSNSKLINSNFQVHTLKRPPPIHANTFILNRSFF